MFNCEIKINNKSDTKALAAKLAKALPFNSCICLIGELGSGKTFFSQCLISSMCNSKVLVTSPTFNLVNIYDCNNTQQIWHLDLYRITHEEEVLELGLEEALNYNLVIIEWANLLHHLYPKNALTITLTAIGINSRIALLNTKNHALAEILKEAFIY